MHEDIGAWDSTEADRRTIGRVDLGVGLDRAVGIQEEQPDRAGVAAVVLTGLAYGQLEPRYRLADQVPDQEQALAGSARLDKKLTGANPVHVMIELPQTANGGDGV